MQICDFDGTVIDVSDEDVEKLLRKDYQMDEVCRYHREKGGISCDQKKRTDADCERCGWNPKVARRRIWKIREERNSGGDSV